jgi:hypothetical protein
MKGTIYKEDKIIINRYVPNIGTPNSIKQTLLDIKGQISPDAVIVVDPSHQKINHPDGNKTNQGDTSELSNNID